jgi:2-haloacid dehalogenase
MNRQHRTGLRRPVLCFLILYSRTDAGYTAPIPGNRNEKRGEGMKVSAVLWDVDGTLLNFHASERQAVRTCFDRFSLGPCSDEMLADYARINLRWWQLLERGERTKHEILIGRFRELFDKYGISCEDVVEFNDEYQIRLGDTIVFEPGAKETVLALRGRVPQFAVTNGTKTAQQRKLARSGLEALLDAVFISEDVGAEKPSLRFFDAVFARLGGIPRDETVIVGDSLTSDIPGGINAGIRTVWYDPKGLPLPEGMRVDAVIRSIPEVLALMD